MGIIGKRAMKTLSLSRLKGWLVLAGAGVGLAGPAPSAWSKGAAGPSPSQSQATNHWAFRAPVRPALPPVQGQTWARNPIDLFILAKLESAGLKPSPEADRITLLRRLYLDLTG